MNCINERHLEIVMRSIANFFFFSSSSSNQLPIAAFQKLKSQHSQAQILGKWQSDCWEIQKQKKTRMQQLRKFLKARKILKCLGKNADVAGK